MGGSGGGVSWGGVLGIVTLVILGMTAAGFVYWKRTQQQMREQGKGGREQREKFGFVILSVCRDGLVVCLLLLPCSPFRLIFVLFPFSPMFSSSRILESHPLSSSLLPSFPVVRSILAEYMPLDDAPGDNNPSSTAGGGSVDSFSGSKANTR